MTQNEMIPNASTDAGSHARDKSTAAIVPGACAQRMSDHGPQPQSIASGRSGIPGNTDTLPQASKLVFVKQENDRPWNLN